MDSKTETVSDNELIAQFMGQSGLTKVFRGKIVPYVPAYDALWGLLMPVIEKIDSLHNEKFNYDSEKIAKGDWPKDDEYIDVIALPMNTSILETHKAVVKFIRWYNSQSPATI